MNTKIKITYNNGIAKTYGISLTENAVKRLKIEHVYVFENLLKLGQELNRNGFKFELNEFLMLQNKNFSIASSLKDAFIIKNPERLFYAETTDKAFAIIIANSESEVVSITESNKFDIARKYNLGKKHIDRLDLADDTFSVNAKLLNLGKALNEFYNEQGDYTLDLIIDYKVFLVHYQDYKISILDNGKFKIDYDCTSFTLDYVRTLDFIKTTYLNERNLLD